MNAAASGQRPLLVIGAGISGVTCALEAAEAGRQVLLLEREAFVGGRVLRAHQYFPKLCPPSCGMEINVRRMERNPRVEVMTAARVTKATAKDGGWEVTLTRAPGHVNERCTLCGECSKVCPARVPDPFNLNLVEVPAIRLPHAEAWPRRYVLDRHACPAGCTKCVEACKYDAIDLAAAERVETRDVGAVVVATGWKPYPVERLGELGGGVLKDVIANVHLERLASPAGPTQGKILRPSDGKAPGRVAFVQCAGSRDVNHLPYCSGVCCLASLKQAIYVREQLPDAEVTIYYIDRRTPGRNEELLTRVAAMKGVRLVKGKVGKIEKGEPGGVEGVGEGAKPREGRTGASCAPDGGALVLHVEDVDASRVVTAQADLAVLATGMVPTLRDEDPPFGLKRDEDGFLVDDPSAGVLAAGVARRPEDVASSVRGATAAAARAMAATPRPTRGDA
jgi:quinone-modifying oxidoreductase subunit QmoA